MEISMDLVCLVTKTAKGKVLISLFPEELYILDFYPKCEKNYDKIHQTFNFKLQVLQPLSSRYDLHHKEPPFIENGKTYTVEPGKSCIFRTVSKVGEKNAIFPYKKPIISHTEMEHNQSYLEKFYTYNGIDLDGGL